MYHCCLLRTDPCRALFGTLKVGPVGGRFFHEGGAIFTTYANFS